MIDIKDSNGQRAIEVCRTIQQNGKEAWLVGGAMRDLLMGRTPSDFDIATNASTDQIMRWFPRVIPTGIKHGTVTVLDGEHQYEVTSYRGESGYSDGRRPDNTYPVHTIQEDLARRDFCMNAIAWNPVSNVFCDPFGGCADILTKKIRCVGNAFDRFREDGLRCLRACRFAATLGFEIDAATKAAIIENLDTYKLVSVERIVSEWRKCMTAPDPSIGFALMAETGLLGATVPEFVASFGCVQNKYHAYNVWQHTLAVLSAVKEPRDPMVQFAALFHDVSKSACIGVHPSTGERTFYNHEEVGADTTRAIMTRLKFPTDEIDKVSLLVRHHLIPREMMSSSGVRRWVRKVGAENVEQILQLAQADLEGKGPAKEKIPTGAVMQFRYQIEHVGKVSPIVSKTSQLAINGNDVMTVLGCGPGKNVGETMNMLLECVTETPEVNTRDGLISLLKSMQLVGHSHGQVERNDTCLS